MPNLTVNVAADRPPIVDLLVAATEARVKALKDAGLPVPRPVLVPALLDTGAGESLMARGVADELGLDPSGSRDIFGVAGDAPEVGPVYRARLFFAGVPAVELASTARVIAVEDPSRFGVRMLVGRDLLSRCALLYNGPHGLCTFAFRSPRDRPSWQAPGPRRAGRASPVAGRIVPAGEPTRPGADDRREQGFEVPRDRRACRAIPGSGPAAARVGRRPGRGVAGNVGMSILEYSFTRISVIAASAPCRHKAGAVMPLVWRASSPSGRITR